ncbi:charged multivesicular body protein [Acrasis kona]|uniref:Charged multivesicular body protein n=1 Tax=Acrasis kona TaxID=1008807 RepID=A0AAW2YIN8_9EUKA
MNWFGTKQEQPTMRQTIRQNKRDLDKEGRNMDRERQTLQMQEKQIQAEIKQALKKGDQTTAKMLAKQIVNIRKQEQRLLGMKGTMQSMGHKQSAMGATHAMTSAMKNSANVMAKVNQQMDNQEIMKITQEFSKQNEMMGMKEEMVDDAIDGIFEDDEDEVDDAVEQIYDELGLELGGNLGGIKTGSKLPAGRRAQVEEDDDEADDLLRRLGALK